VDWTGGLDWWTDIFMLKITFVLYNETSLSCRFNYEAFLIRKHNFLCVDLKWIIIVLQLRINGEALLYFVPSMQQNDF